MIGFRSFWVTALATGAAMLVTTYSNSAHACGCFAPPDPSVPVVQAGERILFSHEDGKITAHIQIQYQGEANEFGWLLPLPSRPQLKLGVEELFAQLINTTQPKYRLVRQADGTCGGIPVFAGGESSPPGRDFSDEDDGSGVVEIQGSIGPFDFAVLRADEAKPMFDWLVENSYVIPTGTQDVVGPYINPGAFFLALKLRKGNDAGDIQPVVVEYESDLPMIPIVLTSVAAAPDMGIQVWVLGESRAIPRNYRHTVLNEEYIDWFTAGSNYNDVIIKATNEADNGQSFVTEYAGTSEVMQKQLNWDGRFGDRAALAATTDAGAYVSRLRQDGFLWSSGLVAQLRRNFPMPDRLRDDGVTEDDYYQSLDFYLNRYRERNPEVFEGVDLSFDPAALTDELWARIVEPTLEAGALFDRFSKLTRLYTTLSPDEMTADPVFSFNPDLPDVSNIHEATFVFDCEDASRGVLNLPDGRRFVVRDPSNWVERPRVGVPYSRRIEALFEEGAPLVQTDNATRISSSDAEGGGCASVGPNPGAASAWLFAMVLAGFTWRRRRA